MYHIKQHEEGQEDTETTGIFFVCKCDSGIHHWGLFEQTKRLTLWYPIIIYKPYSLCHDIVYTYKREEGGLGMKFQWNDYEITVEPKDPPSGQNFVLENKHHFLDFTCSVAKLPPDFQFFYPVTSKI